MSTATLPPSVEDREARIRELTLTLRERQVAAALRRQEDAEKREAKLRESWANWDGFRSLDLVIDRVRAADHALGHAPISTVNDRRWGHNWPFWRTWQEHAGLRANARTLEGLSSLVPGALRGLQSYVIGTGYTYRATSKNDAPKPLVDAVQDIIDEFRVLNSWAQMEKEGFYRSRRDGELLHEHIPDNGRLMVGVIEPEEIYPPNGDSQDWSYGIRTVGRATHVPLAYAVIDDPYSWETRPYSAEDVLHFKCNVDARVKRGKTDLCYDTADIFRTAGRLADHIGTGAAIQASIALIRQHAQADASAVANFRREQAQAEGRDPLGNTRDVQVWESGTELDINAGQEYVVPPFAQNVQGFLGVVKGILQCVAVRWNAPEWLVSADASNNNYASSITAESPFVKRCYSEQEDYKAFFLKSVWAAIRVAAEAGRIVAAGKAWGWDEVRHLVDVQAEAPNIEVRDDAKTAQTDKTYIEAGVKSVQTVQQELGLDAEQEEINIRQWRQRTGQDGDGEKGNDLTSPTLLELQQAYYSGQLPKVGAVANVMLVFGLSQQQAEAIFPGEPTPRPAPTLPEDGGQESRRRRRRKNLREGAGWDESKHKRADDGRFGSGGGHGKKDQEKSDKKQADPDKGGQAQSKDRPAAGDGEDWGDGQATDWGEVTGRQTGDLDRMARDAAKREQVKQAWKERTLGVLRGAGKGLQRGVQAVYDRLPGWGKGLWDGTEKLTTGLGKAVKNTLSTLAAAYSWLEHNTLGKVREFSERLAIQAAKERGLSDHDVKRVGEVVRITDNLYAWSANIPLAHEFLHHLAHIDGWMGFGLAKVGFFTPLASVLYTAYSTARNPLATLRAAGKVLMGTDVGRAHYQQHGKPHGDKQHAHESSGRMQEPLGGKELMGELLQRLHDAGDGADWYYALFCRGVGMFHDSRTALAAADEAFARHPRGDGLADAVTPEEYATVLDDYEPPAAYQAHAQGGGQGGKESATWDESQHQRADDGRFGSGAGAKIKAGHAERKQALRAEHREKRAALHATHKPAKAEIEASLKDAVAGEKAAGKAKLKKLAGKQKKLRTQKAALEAQKAAAEKATADARQLAGDAQAGGGYLGDLLAAELGDPADYSARELGEAVARLHGSHAWDPADDPDWSATEYDEEADAEKPTHTPEETRAEKARRAEGRAQLKELGLKLLAHGRAEGRGAGLADRIEDLDGKIDDLGDARQDHVAVVNERIAGHRARHRFQYDQAKEKIGEDKAALKDEYRDRHDDLKDATRAELGRARDARRAGREKK